METREETITPDRLYGNIGNLIFDLNSLGLGKVELDGNNFPVKEMTIRIRPGYASEVDVKFYPGNIFNRRD